MGKHVAVPAAKELLAVTTCSLISTTSTAQWDRAAFRPLLCRWLKPTTSILARGSGVKKHWNVSGKASGSACLHGSTHPLPLFNSRFHFHRRNLLFHHRRFESADTVPVEKKTGVSLIAFSSWAVLLAALPTQPQVLSFCAEFLEAGDTSPWQAAAGSSAAGKQR